MAREDMLIDEGATFGRRRRSTPTTPATAAEVQAALDAAATELDVNAADAQFPTTELFSPVGGGQPVAGASIADADMFMREGYTPGTLPPEYRTLFGNDPDVIGYKVTTNPDGSQSVTVAKAQGDADGGLQFQTYGAKIKTDASGKVTPFTATPIAGVNGIAGSGTGLKTAEQIAADAKAAQDKAGRQSAYDLLYAEFDRYGLGSLVTPLKDLITSGVSPSEFTIRLRETDAYKKRFAANEARIKNGLRALSEFEYITKEDAYQEVMRRRGLPPEYYAKGDMGIQKGFESLISGDVSSTELEDRIVTAQDRVLNANPEIAKTLKEFYPGISNGDILAYALDPVNAINSIKRKITAAEIGVAAKQEGLTSGLSRAEELATLGITGATAAQGYQAIGGGLQRGSQLASIYGEDPYTQTSAEQEIFKLQGAQEARKQRQKITGLEKATFSGQSGISSGALARDRAGAY
jgi:hypothetical protein